MKLHEMTWPEASTLDRETVVVVPTGSLEQHGAHLPLFTDTLLVSAVCDAVEANLPNEVLLVPPLWLGASAHHMAFAGTCSANHEAYMGALRSILESLNRHPFWKFYVVNGHGGNTSLNDLTLREFKSTHPNVLVGAVGYFEFGAGAASQAMRGPSKTIQHACEAETSLMLHLHPKLVRTEKLRDDGISSPVPGMIHPFDEITEAGSVGFATFAKAETGKAIFDACVNGLTDAIRTIHAGYRLS